MNNWISVKDRLPEEHTAVLCIVKYVKPDRWYTYALLVMQNSKWVQFWGDEELEEDYCVTHWQLLPEPPKGD